MIFQLSNQPHHKIEMQQFISLILDQQQTKKCFAIQDAYKLIYQAVFGIEHILDNHEAAKRYLAQELETIVAGDAEELIENISLPGNIVRLNLKPYKCRHGDADKLFDAMLRSAALITGSREDFLKLWGYFKQAVNQNKLDFNFAELEAFDKKVQSENYPPTHHSPQYREANQPSYRVLQRGVAEQLLLKKYVPRT
jgi:hypothetical protein